MYYLLLITSFLMISCQPKQIDTAQVDMLVETYFKFQKALTEDSSEHTAHYIADIRKSAKTLEIDQSVKQRLLTSLDAYNGISDLKTQRNLFQELSNSVALLINTVGYSSDVYVMQCPMAFEGKGGTWLQASTDLINPYYGSEMLKCGDQVTVIAAKN
ncbi:MAG: DUF3347 domain-containing protein [Calditrichaeota bacterium]|nr:DUF3347 domain-containing protein [Calditrichota bacterium]